MSIRRASLRPPARRRRRDAGVSLLEVLAAMTLFALVASGMAAFAATSMRFGAMNRAAGSAHMLAQEELERQRGRVYANVGSETRTETVAGQDFTIDTTVQSDTPAANMSHVTVTVSWTGPMGPQSYALETIFACLNCSASL